MRPPPHAAKMNNNDEREAMRSDKNMRTIPIRYIARLIPCALILYCVACVDNSFPTTLCDTNALISSDSDFTLPGGYQLSWSDEFNGAVIDPTTWRYDTAGNSSGWGNNEDQTYTEAGNAYIEDGALVIEAKYTAGEYTSARLHTHGNRSFHYGIIAARIRQPHKNGVPDGGVWPAFWTVGDNFNGWGHHVFGGDTPWPRSGEIDIMEQFGANNGDPNRISSALHWYVANQAQDCQYTPNPYISNHCSTGRSLTSVDNVYTTYHVYGLEWNAEWMRFFVNDRTVFAQRITDSQFDPFRLPHFVILNIAVGGNPVGAPSSANYPQKMYVDWVRYYECAS